MCFPADCIPSTCTEPQLLFLLNRCATFRIRSTVVPLCGLWTWMILQGVSVGRGVTHCWLTSANSWILVRSLQAGLRSLNCLENIDKCPCCAYPLIQNCLHCLLPPHPSRGLPPPPVPPPPLPPPHLSRDLASAAASRTACTPTQTTGTASTCVPEASPTSGSAGPDLCLTTRASAVRGPERGAVNA